MREHPLPTLDSLLSYDQPVSDPIEVEIGTARTSIAFKLLSREDITECELLAQKQMLEALDDVGLEGEHLNSPLVADAIENETEIQLLAASMVDPKSPGGRSPAFSAERLRRSIQPNQQTKLNGQWWIWQTSQDPAEITVDAARDILEDIKKNGNQGVLALIGYGSGMLLSCIIILVEELEKLETAKLSDGA